MEQVIPFKERQKLLFEKSRKYQKMGYKLISQKNFSLRMKANPIYFKKMKKKKRAKLFLFLLLGRNLLSGPRKNFVDMSVDMYGHITAVEAD
jgi:hypothetical protein